MECMVPLCNTQSIIIGTSKPEKPKTGLREKRKIGERRKTDEPVKEKRRRWTRHTESETVVIHRNNDVDKEKTIFIQFAF